MWLGGQLDLDFLDFGAIDIENLNPVYLEILGCWMEASLDFKPNV